MSKICKLCEYIGIESNFITQLFYYKRLKYDLGEDNDCAAVLFTVDLKRVPHPRCQLICSASASRVQPCTSAQLVTRDRLQNTNLRYVALAFKVLVLIESWHCPLLASFIVTSPFPTSVLVHSCFPAVSNQPCEVRCCTSVDVLRQYRTAFLSREYASCAKCACYLNKFLSCTFCCTVLLQILSV